jgi:catalase
MSVPPPDGAHPQLAVDIVDRLEWVSGLYPGYRRAHAKGACYRAVFLPTGAAAEYTTAAHLQGDPVPATVRFSNFSGNPYIWDRTRSARGLSVAFHLPGGVATDLVSVSQPVFVAATPQAFRNFLEAAEPNMFTGSPDPEVVRKYATEHTEAMRGLRAVKNTPIPVSYATLRYWAVHAFIWLDKMRRRTAVRYRWEPEAGVQQLSDERAAEKSPTYLSDELAERLATTTVAFQLKVQIAEPGDPTNDCTVLWPHDRAEITVGRLLVTGPVEDQAKWDRRMFDPTRLVPGIELSDDPVLRFRSQVYAVSHGRRTQGK